MLEVGFVGLEHAREVLEDLLGLGTEIADPDEVAFRVERDLSGDVDPHTIDGFHAYR